MLLKSFFGNKFQLFNSFDFLGNESFISPGLCIFFRLVDLSVCKLLPLLKRLSNVAVPFLEFASIFSLSLHVKVTFSPFYICFLTVILI
jgi:hypothetical protein